MQATIATYLAVLAICSILTYQASAFDYSGFCRQKCMRGHGGNLCKCNAVHFAGKRTGMFTEQLDSSSDGSLDGLIPSSSNGVALRKKLADALVQNGQNSVNDIDTTNWLESASRNDNQALPVDDKSDIENEYVQQLQSSNQ